MSSPDGTKSLLAHFRISAIVRVGAWILSFTLHILHKKLVRVDAEQIQRQMQEVAVRNYNPFISAIWHQEVSSIDKHLESLALIMDAGTGFKNQVYELSHVFSHKEWIMEQWEKNYYISSIAGENNGSSLVVMSKGTHYIQQLYKVNDSFPFKWINMTWREGFHVTSTATALSRWGVVISRNSGYSEQVLELDFLYLKHKRRCVSLSSLAHMSRHKVPLHRLAEMGNCMVPNDTNILIVFLTHRALGPSLHVATPIQGDLSANKVGGFKTTPAKSNNVVFATGIAKGSNGSSSSEIT